MATATVPVQTSSRVRLKYLLFGFIGLMIGYVLVHNESFLVHRDAPVWQHYHPFRWWLLPHGIAGACAILLGPLQFSDRLRQRLAATVLALLIIAVLLANSFHPFIDIIYAKGQRRIGNRYATDKSRVAQRQAAGNLQRVGAQPTIDL